MRILHVIPAIAARYGGPSSAIRALCGALAKRPGMHVELVTTDADGAGGRLPAEDVPAEFPTHVCHRSFSERWKYSPELARWCDQNVARFDVVHIHAVWSHSTLAAASAASRYQVPYVIRPAGMLSQYSMNHRATWKRIYWSMLERRTAEQASLFHATSQAEAEDIRTVLPAARTTVVANGVEDAAWTVARQPAWLREHLGVTKEPRPLLLFLSRLHPKKGVVDLLLPALAQLKCRPLLVIAGGTDEHSADYERQIRRQIDALNMSADVRVTGAVAPADRWRWLDGADAFVLPSHSENFGIVVAEAMARACPVIITDQVQSFDHVVRANAGFVVKTNPQELAEAIRKISELADHGKSMGEAGREYAVRNFQWLNIASQVEEIYKVVSSACQ